MPKAESRRFAREAERESPRLPPHPDAYYGQVRERTATRLAAVRSRAELPLDGDEFFIWAQEQPGHPLGAGMPMGAPLRMDGESHSNAWRRILRADPCAYCGARVSGTVDHVVPRCSGRAGVERWPNLVGACTTCNTSKEATSLLLFLAGKRGLVLAGLDEQRAHVMRSRPDRTVAEADEIARVQLRHRKKRKHERYAA